MESKLSLRKFERLRALFEIFELPPIAVMRTRIKLLAQLKPARRAWLSLAVTKIRPTTVAFKARHLASPRFTERGKPVKTYSIIPITPRLAAHLSHPTRSSQLRRPTAGRSEHISTVFYIALLHDLKQRPVISDLAQIPLQVHEHLMFQSERELSLSMSTDGINLFNRQSADCWPILPKFNNRPLTTSSRRQNLMLAALIPGPKQFKDAKFLKPVMDELVSLAKGIKAWNGHAPELFTLRAHVTHVFGDMQALYKVMRMKGPASSPPLLALRDQRCGEGHDAIRASLHAIGHSTGSTTLVRSFGRHNETRRVLPTGRTVLLLSIQPQSSFNYYTGR